MALRCQCLVSSLSVKYVIVFLKQLIEDLQSKINVER